MTEPTRDRSRSRSRTPVDASPARRGARVREKPAKYDDGVDEKSSLGRMVREASRLNCPSRARARFSSVITRATRLNCRSRARGDAWGGARRDARARAWIDAMLAMVSCWSRTDGSVARLSRSRGAGERRE